MTTMLRSTPSKHTRKATGLRGRPLLRTSYDQDLTLANTPAKRRSVVALVIASFVVPFLLTDDLLQVLTLGMISAVGAIGLNLVTGYAGQVSLGHAFFIGVGAYTGAVLGGVLDPFAAYLLVRGLKTFALRIARQNDNAQRLAEFLEAHPKVQRVHYAGLASHPQHEIARRQMRGFGGVVSFEIAGDLDAGTRLVDACQIPQIAPSLGGVESLIEQPALMSFFELTTEERLAVGIKDNLIRLSVGLEDADDLIDDLRRALE